MEIPWPSTAARHSLLNADYCCNGNPGTSDSNGYRQGGSVPRKCLLFSGHRAEAGHVDSIERGMLEHGGVRPMRYNFSADLSSDTLAGQARAFGEAMTAMVPVFERLAPTFVLVYGDRGEAFAAALAAARMGIPVVHVEAGDWTEGGVLDDNARHSISKLACLHFATTEHAAQQVIAMGEEPWRVKVCGLPILDFVAAGDFTPEAEVRAKYGLQGPFTLVCHHPVPGEEPLDVFYAIKGGPVFVIRSNGDAGSDAVNKALEGFPGAANVPRADFHGLMNACWMMVGNSSSFVKEAPAFGKPVLLVGDRQKGRYPGPYKAMGAGRIIADVLATVNLDGLTIKRRAA